MRIYNFPQFLRELWRPSASTSAYKNLQGILVVGRDRPFVNFYAEIIKRQTLPMRSVDKFTEIEQSLQKNDLFSEPSSQLNSYHVQKVSASDLINIQNFLHTITNDKKSSTDKPVRFSPFLILEAPGLKIKSKLVNFFISNPLLALCPAYEVDVSVVKMLLKMSAQEHNFVFSPQQLLRLSDHYTETPAYFFKDIEKFALYQSTSESNSGTFFTDHDLDFLMTPTSSKTVDLIIDAFFLKKFDALFKYSRQSIYLEHDFLLLRSLQNQASQLADICAKLERGLSFEKAIASCAQRVFFHRKPFIKQATLCWSSHHLLMILEQLLLLEKNYKDAGFSENQLLQGLSAILFAAK